MPTTNELYHNSQKNKKEVIKIYSQFIKRVAKKKIDLGLTNEDLARMTGYQVTTIRMAIAKNRPRPSIPVYRKLAEALNIPFKEG